MVKQNSTIIPFPKRADGQGKEAHISGMLLHGFESGQPIESIVSSIRSVYPGLTNEQIDEFMIAAQDELRMQGRSSVPTARKVASINYLIAPLLESGKANTFTQALQILSDQGNETARALLQTGD